MIKLAVVALWAGAAVLTMPASALADPSLRASPNQGEVGDDVALKGRGWFVGGGCANRVVLYFKQGDRSLKLGSAVHGDGAFVFNTHYQQAKPGPARFVARQACDDRVYRRSADVTVGRGGGGDGDGDETVAYRGQTEHGGRVSFIVVDGNEVRRFRFMNRCSADRRLGSRVPGGMPIGDISFSRRGREFTIFGRFRSGGLVNGSARQQTGGCDSGKMAWSARRVG
jgi:hypothetical protein